jgi:hypothetical protein
MSKKKDDKEEYIEFLVDSSSLDKAKKKKKKVN